MKFNVDDLVEQGLVKKKTYTDGRFKGLSVLKYTNRVFFKNLWHLDERLMDCRGTVVDEDDNIVVWPFTKVFNVGENFTEIDPEEFVVAPRKVNGFMASVTKDRFRGVLVGTTGTLDSDYAKLATVIVGKPASVLKEGFTYLFEICHESDPHIVPEEEGAYLIGMRNLSNGKMLSELELDHEAHKYGFKRPEVFVRSFKDLPEVKHEGFMIRDLQGNYLAKVKSSYYLATKAFLRMGKNRIDLAWKSPDEFKEQIDEEFYEFHQWLLDNFTEEEYNCLNQEERRALINDYFENRT